MPDARERVLLDACTLLNLCASGCCERILRESEMRFGVIDYVLRTEALHVQKGGGGPDARERIPVDLKPLVDAGMLDVVEVSGEAEAATFLNLAMQLDDGEARTLAVALHRRWAVATDDRKTRRLIANSPASIRVFGTLKIVKQWADAQAVSQEELRSILLNIRERGNFLPGRQDPLGVWWRSLVESS
ncbi:MAG TPA: hypothetical protein VF746_29530 [Longimicrobium sp.]